MTPTPCSLCGHPRNAAEANAYGSRCEDCWTALPYETAPALGNVSAAQCYSKFEVGEAKAITNQAPAFGTANLAFRRQRKRK